MLKAIVIVVILIAVSGCAISEQPKLKEPLEVVSVCETYEFDNEEIKNIFHEAIDEVIKENKRYLSCEDKRAKQKLHIFFTKYTFTNTNRRLIAASITGSSIAITVTSFINGSFLPIIFFTTPGPMVHLNAEISYEKQGDSQPIPWRLTESSWFDDEAEQKTIMKKLVKNWLVDLLNLKTQT